MKVMTISVNSYNFFCENKMKNQKLALQLLTVLILSDILYLALMKR